MRKTLFIVIVAFLSFGLEFLLFNSLGPWFLPNLLLLLVIFINLAWGIRYSLFTAVIAGVLKDSFAIHPFGIYLFSFVLCAFLTTFFKKFIYQVGSSSSRLFLAFIICLVCFLSRLLLHVAFGSVLVRETFRYVFLPETFMTLIVTNYLYYKFKACVLRYFV